MKNRLSIKLIFLTALMLPLHCTVANTRPMQKLIIKNKKPSRKRVIHFSTFNNIFIINIPHDRSYVICALPEDYYNLKIKIDATITRKDLSWKDKRKALMKLHTEADSLSNPSSGSRKVLQSYAIARQTLKAQIKKEIKKTYWSLISFLNILRKYVPKWA